MKIKVFVETNKKELYEATYSVQDIETPYQSKKAVETIINEVLEEFDNDQTITIKIFEDTVFKNGKKQNTTTLFKCGKNYLKYFNLLGGILNEF